MTGGGLPCCASIVPEVIAAIGDGASGMHAGSRAVKTCPVSGFLVGQGPSQRHRGTRAHDSLLLLNSLPPRVIRAQYCNASLFEAARGLSCTGSVSRLQPSAAVSKLLPVARLSQHPGPCDPTVPVRDLTLSFPALLSRGVIQSVNSGTRSPVSMLFDLWEQARLLWPQGRPCRGAAHQPTPRSLSTWGG